MKNPVTAPGAREFAPQFIRLPRSGERCPHSGLSRSKMNELILPSAANNNNPPVRSIVQKKRHAVRGIRLISYASLIDHLNSLDGESVSAATSEACGGD